MKKCITHSIKTTSKLAAFAACATLMATSHVYGEEEGEEKSTLQKTVEITLERGKEMLGELPKPVTDTAAEALKANNYLGSVSASFDKNQKALAALEADYKKAHASAKSKDERQKVSTNYLKKRIELIKSIRKDLEFAVQHFEQTVEKVGMFLGDIDGNKDLAAKAAEELAKTQELEEKIKEIKRKHVLLQSENPQRGTPEHTKLLKDRRELINEHERAMGDFENAVYLSEVFSMYSTQLKASGDQVEGWQNFIDGTLGKFSKAIQSLETAQTGNEIALAASQGLENFKELGELGPLADMAVKIAADVKILPKVEDLGSIPDAPKIERPSLDGDINFDQLREKIKGGLKHPKDEES